MIDSWDDTWGSIHEAGHACCALHFGLTVERLTLKCATIPHARYCAFDDRNSVERLIVSAAGCAATTLFLDWREGGRADVVRSWERLEVMGADGLTATLLILQARDQAYALVPSLRPQIFAVARALRERGTLEQREIDDAVAKGSTGAWSKVLQFLRDCTR